MDIKKCIAEFMGTFTLCFVGCGAAVLNNNPVAGPLIFVFLIRINLLQRPPVCGL